MPDLTYITFACKKETEYAQKHVYICEFALKRHRIVFNRSQQDVASSILYMYINIHIHIYTYTYMCMCVYMYLYMYPCAYV